MKPVVLSSRFSEALAWAATLHAGQPRKGTTIPYVSHLLAVAALVLEHGGTGNEAIAALLHDAVEDQPRAGATEREIRERFGADVLEIVRACSDKAEATDVRTAANWRERKAGYLRHVSELDPHGLRVSLADKVHNARSIVDDLRKDPKSVWDRFNAPRENQLWYYRELSDRFRDAVERVHRGDKQGAAPLWRLWDALENAVLTLEASAVPERHRQPVIVVPSVGPGDWKRLLAKPDCHWKKNQSARSLAQTWEQANGFPDEIKRVLSTTSELASLEPVFVIPEYRVPLEGAAAPRKTMPWLWPSRMKASR